MIRWAELFAAPFSALAEYAMDRVGVKLRSTMAHAKHTNSMNGEVGALENLKRVLES
ncbi:MAG TPA: hypothetical protein VFP31_09055 [Gaiellaceae bacterium]|nr:hypothetical protein [Gaiellaceae bacterium]